MKVICWLAGLAISAGPAVPAERLSNFRTSVLHTSSGRASEVVFSTGLVELESGALAHHLPAAMKSFRFSEPVWLIGYRTDILDAQGRTPGENYLCHTFLGDQRVMQREDQELKGIYSDAFTPEVRLPEGFGIPVAADESLHWMPMFNNRGDTSVRVAMRVTLTVIRTKDLKQPLKPLFASLRSVQVPHLFFLSPGRDEREARFEFPFDGRIHFLGTHIHPYGVSIELHNESRGEIVWKGTRSDTVAGPMQVYSSAAGYAVRAGEKYRIKSVYQNPTGHEIDGMAGLFFLYSRD